MSRRKFYLNKHDGKLMGVCSGLAEWTGIDALWIRVAAVVSVLAGFGIVIPVYIAIGLLASDPEYALAHGAE
jgi:phage shock protein C